MIATELASSIDSDAYRSISIALPASIVDTTLPNFESELQAALRADLRVSRGQEPPEGDSHKDDRIDRQLFAHSADQRPAGEENTATVVEEQSAADEDVVTHEPTDDASSDASADDETQPAERSEQPVEKDTDARQSKQADDGSRLSPEQKSPWSTSSGKQLTMAEDGDGAGTRSAEQVEAGERPDKSSGDLQSPAPNRAWLDAEGLSGGTEHVGVIDVDSTEAASADVASAEAASASADNADTKGAIDVVRLGVPDVPRQQISEVAIEAETGSSRHAAVEAGHSATEQAGDEARADGRGNIAQRPRVEVIDLSSAGDAAGSRTTADGQQEGQLLPGRQSIAGNGTTGGERISNELNDYFLQRLQSQLRDSQNARIVQHARFLLHNHRNDGEIRLLLKPDQLGTVRIQLQLQDNQIAGRIIVENSAVRDIFEQNIGNLQRTFREQGFDSTGIEVALENGRKQEYMDSQSKREFLFQSGDLDYSVPLLNEITFNSELIDVYA